MYRSTTTGFTPSSSNLVATASGTSFGNTGLNASTTYYYVIEAADQEGSSSASAQTSATTQAPTNGGINTGAWYHVTTTYNSVGLCLDDANGSTSNGAVLQQYSCGNGYNQQWQFRPGATNGYFAVFNRYATALVWDNTGGSTSNGNKIQLYTYNSGDANQEWQAQQVGTNFWKFVNLRSGLCLDSTTSSNNAIQLQQYQCIAGDWSQEFQLTQEP